MTDLAELLRFLNAQLDEDERAARRAGETFRQIGDTGVIVATEGGRAEECASANWAGIAEHIARHDPARVLREVEAKRQFLDFAVRTRDLAERQPTEGQARELRAKWAAYLTALKFDTLPYSDHPSFREEWKP